MPKRRPTHAKNSIGTPRLESPGDSNANTLLSRRGFLYGAIGVGAIALAAGGTVLVKSLGGSDDVEDIPDTLAVPTSAVTESTDLLEVDAANHLAVVGEFILPYGTLLWSSNDAVAACLIPNAEGSSPLTRVGLLYFNSGSYPIMLDGAVSTEKGFEIYDVRANETGMVWTEANIVQGIWRIFTASMRDGVLGEAVLVDQGDSEWETPTIAIADNYAFWQVLPSLSGTKTTEDSLFKRARIGNSESEVVYSSTGRMSTPPYALKDSVVITPRVNTSGVYHQLTLIDATEATVRDRMVIPQSMKPLEAGYGTTGFNFTFDGIYNYGDGIANLGTYTPMETHSAQDYQGLSWFHHAKNPSAAPCWCGKYFLVKSTMQVLGFDFAEGSYFILNVDTGSDDYGDYLGSTGTNETAVTYANINAKTLAGDERRHTQVRVWRPV